MLNLLPSTYVHDTCTRNRRRKPVPDYWYYACPIRYQKRVPEQIGTKLDVRRVTGFHTGTSFLVPVLTPISGKSVIDIT